MTAADSPLWGILGFCAIALVAVCLQIWVSHLIYMGSETKKRHDEIMGRRKRHARPPE